MDLYTFLLLAGLIALFIAMEYFRDRKYWNRIDKLLNRLQAKDYEQFRYFEDQYKKEVDQYHRQMEKLEREEENETKDVFVRTGSENQEKMITPEVLEEDWSEEELKEVKDQTQ